jgi:DNA polymerase IV
MGDKIIFHLDMDQFFAAVEIQCQPHLRGKPVIVGGSPSGRGIVTTASYEARRFGVRSGMPAIEAARLCPQAVFVRCDHGKYMDVSRRVFSLLHAFTDRVQQTSVDEAYMDVTHVAWQSGGVDSLAYAIKHRVRTVEGLTCTIGGGPNRLVAKVASGMKKPDGYTYIPRERIAEVFCDMPVGDLYGVGKATQRILEGFGIRTAGQLAEFPEDILRRRFGKFGNDLSRIARGEGADDVLVEEERPLEKSMGHEQTFQNVHDTTLLLGRLHLLCERVARRLRAGDMAGRVVTVKIRYKGFETVIHGRKIKTHVQHEMFIYPVAEQLFHEAYRKGEDVRLVGVHVSDLLPVEDILQQELFVQKRETSQLMETCDGIKERYGEASIGFASGYLVTRRRRAGGAEWFNPFHADLMRRKVQM